MGVEPVDARFETGGVDDGSDTALALGGDGMAR